MVARFLKAGVLRPHLRALMAESAVAADLPACKVTSLHVTVYTVSVAGRTPQSGVGERFVCGMAAYTLGLIVANAAALTVDLGPAAVTVNSPHDRMIFWLFLSVAVKTIIVVLRCMTQGAVSIYSCPGKSLSMIVVPEGGMIFRTGLFKILSMTGCAVIFLSNSKLFLMMAPRTAIFQFLSVAYPAVGIYYLTGQPFSVLALPFRRMAHGLNLFIPFYMTPRTIRYIHDTPFCMAGGACLHSREHFVCIGL